ncbi:MAG: hypothetical protein HQL57_06170 [Magnetococcales bacterium]|nr:hypothetical protein [Magnetococcales bacterium]MBF0156754.1 hypothetical protein [Magnetococcales bacterium]
MIETLCLWVAFLGLAATVVLNVLLVRHDDRRMEEWVMRAFLVAVGAGTVSLLL